jgi:hypothetical protein
MGKPSLPRLVPCVLLLAFTSFLLNCQAAPKNPSTPSNPTPTPPVQQKVASVKGVLMWKGDASETGTYSNETTLTPANVNVSQFGRLGSFKADGIIMGQPLYVSGVDMGSGGSHDLVIVTTEHDSVYAIDADNPAAAPVWERHYVDAANGITTMPDNFGGRTTLGGEVGITGTPYVDAKTGILYFVTTLERNGAPEQWLRAIDIRTGQDFGPGSVQIQASVMGDGRGSVNGTIAFDPSNQNQRVGLTKVGGAILVGWGSFSDWGVYHGWLMAYDPASLKQLAVFNPTPDYQPVDAASGPSDYGGGGAFWQGGAAPPVDAAGNIYINAADGSFNADLGGNNYGDTMIKLQFNGSSFHVVDWFTPSNAACIDLHDLELGSGGVALLPTDVTNGRQIAIAYSKEGRLFLVNTDTMGKFNGGGDNQIAQEFMVGQYTCSDTVTADVAEGPGWNRLYGTPAYWNGNVYAGASSVPLQQYHFENGLLNPTPVAMSATAYGLRGGNSVVSANGTQNGIVWSYEKSTSGQGILHAYDATNIATELWNSNMNSGRDGLGEGIGFGTPVVAEGRVIVPYDTRVGIFGLLQ